MKDFNEIKPLLPEEAEFKHFDPIGNFMYLDPAGGMPHVDEKFKDKFPDTQELIWKRKDLRKAFYDRYTLCSPRPDLLLLAFRVDHSFFLVHIMPQDGWMDGWMNLPVNQGSGRAVVVAALEFACANYWAREGTRGREWQGLMPNEAWLNYCAHYGWKPQKE